MVCGSTQATTQYAQISLRHGNEDAASDVVPATRNDEGSTVIDLSGTCDLAVWCKLLRDKGWSGPRIAREIAKSEGYVNNLIRVADRASPNVMLRWRLEQDAPDCACHVCATDWLVQICLL